MPYPGRGGGGGAGLIQRKVLKGNGVDIFLLSLLVLIPGAGMQSNWPDSRLGPFAPKDPCFPLPGNVGVDLAHLPQPAPKNSELQRRSVAEVLLDMESEDVRKAVVMDTYMKDVAEENYEATAQPQVE